MGKRKASNASRSSTGSPAKVSSHGGSHGPRCCQCGVTSTPQWREGPLGFKTLCNACGVKWYRQAKLKRAKKASSSQGGAARGSGASDRAATPVSADEDLPMPCKRLRTPSSRAMHARNAATAAATYRHYAALAGDSSDELTTTFNPHQLATSWDSCKEEEEEERDAAISLLSLLAGVDPEELLKKEQQQQQQLEASLPASLPAPECPMGPDLACPAEVLEMLLAQLSPAEVQHLRQLQAMAAQAYREAEAAAAETTALAQALEQRQQDASSAQARVKLVELLLVQEAVNQMMGAAGPQQQQEAHALAGPPQLEAAESVAPPSSSAMLPPMLLTC